MNPCCVSRVESDTDSLGLTVEITIQRIPRHARIGLTPPRAEDVPADIRAALLAWLTTAEETR